MTIKLLHDQYFRFNSCSLEHFEKGQTLTAHNVMQLKLCDRLIGKGEAVQVKPTIIGKVKAPTYAKHSTT